MYEKDKLHLPKLEQQQTSVFSSFFPEFGCDETNKMAKAVTFFEFITHFGNACDLLPWPG